jgi:hypothetical protein
LWVKANTILGTAIAVIRRYYKPEGRNESGLYAVSSGDLGRFGVVLLPAVSFRTPTPQKQTFIQRELRLCFSGNC